MRYRSEATNDERQRLTRRQVLPLLLAGLTVGCTTGLAPANPAGATSAWPTAGPGIAPTLEPAPTASAPVVASPPPTAARQAAEASPSPLSEERSAVLPGVDVLLLEQQNLLRGKRVGLVTNRTGRDSQGRSTIDLLHAGQDWQLVSLFSPEHGIRGDAEAGEGVQSSIDPQTGLTIHSLYGGTTRPTAAMLRGLDVLVYDIQDVGARVYTYIATLLEVLQAGAAQGPPVVVLDRPNPINGVDVEGTVLDPAFVSLVGPAPIAMRYGMTIGELGRLFNSELGVGADLTVVPLRGWQRTAWYDQTGLAWVNPSPNMRSLAAATLYPGTVLFEATNLSEGRGTDRPFEWIGAPWIDGAAWAEWLNAAGPPGVRFQPVGLTPEGSKHAGRACQGVLIEIVDRALVRPMELGVTMLAMARAIAPGLVQLNPSLLDLLAGTDRVRLALQAGRTAAEISASWSTELQQFLALRERYLFY